VSAFYITLRLMIFSMRMSKSKSDKKGDLSTDPLLSEGARFEQQSLFVQSSNEEIGPQAQQQGKRSRSIVSGFLSSQ
jgi:hypothetical protein